MLNPSECLEAEKKQAMHEQAKKCWMLKKFYSFWRVFCCFFGRELRLIYAKLVILTYKQAGAK